MKAITFHGVSDVRARTSPIRRSWTRPTSCCASPPARCAAPTCTSTTAAAAAPRADRRHHGPRVHGRGGGRGRRGDDSAAGRPGHRTVLGLVRGLRVVPAPAADPVCDDQAARCSADGSVTCWGGGQAERIRVPFADHLCEKVPAELSDDDALFLGDILSTSTVCAENGGIRPGDTWRCSVPARSACWRCSRPTCSARRGVFAVDRVGLPLELAAEFGAEPVSLDKGDPAEQLRTLTGGRGPDVVLECVGHETPFTQAIQAVRAGAPSRRSASTSDLDWASRRARRSSRTSR